MRIIREESARSRIYIVKMKTIYLAMGVVSRNEDHGGEGFGSAPSIQQNQLLVFPKLGRTFWCERRFQARGKAFYLLCASALIRMRCKKSYKIGACLQYLILDMYQDLHTLHSRQLRTHTPTIELAYTYSQMKNSKSYGVRGVSPGATGRRSGR